MTENAPNEGQWTDKFAVHLEISHPYPNPNPNPNPNPYPNPNPQPNVLQEGKPTAALYQIVRGTLRVELQLPDQPQAVVVGYRKPGEMFGETSLLQSGVATASIAADSEATLTRLNTPNPSPYP